MQLWLWFGKKILKKKKKIHPPTPTPKNVVEDNQTIIFLGLIELLLWQAVSKFTLPLI